MIINMMINEQTCYYCCQCMMFYSKRSENPSPRTELLHNINPDASLEGDNLYPDIFDVRVQSAIRVGDYKLLTGSTGMKYCSNKGLVIRYLGECMSLSKTILAHAAWEKIS